MEDDGDHVEGVELGALELDPPEEFERDDVISSGFEQNVLDSERS